MNIEAESGVKAELNSSNLRERERERERENVHVSLSSYCCLKKPSPVFFFSQPSFFFLAS